MKFFAFAFLLVLTLQVTLAADSLTFDNCENLSIQNCSEFRQLNLTFDEQKKQFSSLLEIRSNMSVHDFIFDWNTKLNFDNIPDAVLPENYMTIKDAWLAITSIMPSVLYHEILYNNYSGFVQTIYGYNLTKPSTYFNGDWDMCTKSPPTSPNPGEQGDCRTEYPENWDMSFLNVYLNNNWIGNSTLVLFMTTNTTNTFQSVLNIINKIRRDHFGWQLGNCCSCSRCCWSTGRRTTQCGNDCGRCGCEIYWQHCRFLGTDYRYDSLILQDDKSSLLDEISYSKPKILYDAAKSTAYFIFNVTNADYYELDIGEYKLVKRNIKYTYNYSYIPTNVLTAFANHSQRINANIYSTLEEINNSDFISFILENKNAYNCSMKIFSYFNSYNLTCNVSVLPKTELTITTDKFFYMPNETIMANILIKSDVNTNNDLIQVRYGNDTTNVTGSTLLQIPAQVNANKISAEYKIDLTKQSATAAKTINVYAGENPAYYVNIFWFVIGFLFFISALRMCWIKFAGAEND